MTDFRSLPDIASIPAWEVSGNVSGNHGLRNRANRPGSHGTAVMAGLVPPAGPKPLRRGEGPAIHALLCSLDAEARPLAVPVRSEGGALLAIGGRGR
jgi:hypothetical protein